MSGTSRLPALLALLTCALAAQGCASLGWGFTCPARGGAAWREVSARHVRVQTDLRRAEAQELAREVERLFEAVQRGLFRNPPPIPGQLRVVAFQNEHEFAQFALPGMLAYYLRSSHGDPVVVIHGELDSTSRAIVAHELTHHVLSHVFARQPLWFAEGMATFMETVGEHGEWWKQPTLGGVPSRAVSSSADRVRRVLTARRELEVAEYGVAWAIVHYVANHRPDGFAKLQQRFAAGDEPSAVWRETFPEWDPATTEGPARLDRALRAYLQGGRYVYRRIQLGDPPVVSEGPLTSAQVHAIRLELPRFRPQNPRATGPREPVMRAELLAEADEALAEEPDHLRALLARAAFVPSERAALAERAVAAHPREPLAWVLKASALPDEDFAGREAACRRAVEAAPDHPAALVGLAQALQALGRPADALPVAGRAAKVAPWHPGAFDAQAGALLALGRCPEALGAQRRAEELAAAHLGDREVHERFREHLAEVERRCGAPASSGP